MVEEGIRTRKANMLQSDSEAAQFVVWNCLSAGRS